MKKTMATFGSIAGLGLVLGAMAPASAAPLSGRIQIDGSSTVYPITEAVAEEFRDEHPNVRVTVSVSGTGGGFKRFTVGETDISNASRPIKNKEHDQAVSNGVEYIEIPVAYDGLTIVINKNNDWVDNLTVDELKMIFLEDKAAKTWKDIRSNWPSTPIRIFAPGTDSGTFDYFKEVVAGKTGSIRGDMSVSEDDNVLVNGVAGDRGAIGFFGASYYFENTDKLQSVPIVNPETSKAVSPLPSTIESGEYAPFSRPLFIYVGKKSAEKPEVQAFIDFYFEAGPALAEEVGYVRLPEYINQRAQRKWMTRHTGTHYLDAAGEKKKGSLPEIFR